METPVLEIRFWVGCISAVVFGSFAAYLRLGWRGGALGGRLILALLASCFWSGLDVVGASQYAGELLTASLLLLANLLMPAAWAWFLVGLLALTQRAEKRGGEEVEGLSRSVLSVLVLAAGLFVAAIGSQVVRWGYYGHLLLAVGLLALIEQVWRNFPAGSRWGIKPLVIGLALAQGFDVYLFAEAALFGRIDADIASVRAIVHAMVAPLAAMSAVRSRDWTFRITVSRQLVFHTTALAATGLYLLLIAAAGYYVRWFGGSWGRALQSMLLFAGLVLFAMLAFSGSFRARLRVWVGKHLFALRYDYRESWLKFTQTLGGGAPGAETLEQSLIAALAELIESPGGVLWQRDADNIYRPRAKLNCPLLAGEEAADAPLAKFMSEHGWIVNLEEWRTRSGIYQGLQIPEWLSVTPDAWLLVPLISGGEMLAFVVLMTARTPIEVNWEVLDLLKTAGRQAASYLGRAQAIAALLEAQKFDSFNRMSAFVVHDLKNLVAQLSLMLKNAARHKDNPEFQADMLLTVENVAERMRGLMQQLQNKTSIEQRRWIDMGELCRDLAATQTGNAELIVQAESELGVMAHEERLRRIIGHVVQNAVEASPEHGKVSLSVCHEESCVRLDVRDRGCGMTAEFVRERLFRPFQTTKPNGMGIGAYEVRQYVGELGGTVDVSSTPGQGTEFVIRLPLARRNEVRALEA